MADRKAELERKRAKLNALREEKERKKKEKEQLKKVRICFIISWVNREQRKLVRM